MLSNYIVFEPIFSMTKKQSKLEFQVSRISHFLTLRLPGAKHFFDPKNHFNILKWPNLNYQTIRYFFRSSHISLPSSPWVYQPLVKLVKMQHLFDDPIRACRVPFDSKYHKTDMHKVFFLDNCMFFSC